MTLDARSLLAFPEGLPRAIRCRGERFEFVRQFKHDFFAATGLYASGGGRRVVLKVQRRRPFFGLRLGWLGDWLTRHEMAVYRDLADVPGVPALVGRCGPTGFVHEFVPGRPLGRDIRVGDSFFDELADLLSAVHARGLAYVDLNKRQNILVGEDGRPYLIDFQIAVRLGRPDSPRRRGGAIPQALLRFFQQQDWYHFGKHKRRCRADLMTAAQIAASYRAGPWTRLHRAVSRPYFLIRRGILDRLGLPRGDRAEG